MVPHSNAGLLIPAIGSGRVRHTLPARLSTLTHPVPASPRTHVPHQKDSRHASLPLSRDGRWIPPLLRADLPGPQGRSRRLLHVRAARPSHRSVRRDTAAGRGRGGERAAAGGHLRAQCLPAPSGRPGPGPHYARHAVRRPSGDRSGRRLEQARARRHRHSLRAGWCPDQAPDRGDHDPQGLLRRRAVLLLGRALHHHRPRRHAQAGAAPAPADLPGRRRQAPADPGRTPSPDHRPGAAAGARRPAPRRRPEPDGRGNRGEDQVDPRGRWRPLRRTGAARRAGWPRGSAERAHALSRGAWASIVVVVSWSRKPPDWCCHSRA